MTGPAEKKRRVLVLQVELDMDNWTGEAMGSDESIMDFVDETLTDGMTGTSVTVRRLSSTEEVPA